MNNPQASSSSSSSSGSLSPQPPPQLPIPSPAKRICQNAAKDVELTDLNEDCLLAIFHHLSLKDLNSMGLSCHQLKTVVNAAYKYNPTMQNLDIVKMALRPLKLVPYNCLATALNAVDDVDDDTVYTTEFIEKLKQYLKRFGNYLHHIVFNDSSVHGTYTHSKVKEIFTFIIVYCLGSLKSLKMRGIELDSDVLSKAHLLFMYLTKLDIDERLNWHEVFPMCVNLEELTLTYNRYSIPLDLNYKFSKLKSFTFEVYEKKFRNIDNLQTTFLPALDKFLERNPSIKFLSLKVPHNFNAASIGHLKQLKELNLTIEDAPTDFNYTENVANCKAFSELSHLVKISIDNYEDRIFSKYLPMSVDTLKYLTLEHCTINQTFVRALSRFERIKHLKLSMNKIDGGITMEIWQCLQKLKTIERLELGGNQNITKFIENLHGNCATLKQLTIQNCIINDEFFAGLSKLNHLQMVHIEARYETVADDEGSHSLWCIEWAKYQQFNSVEKLTLNLGQSAKAGDLIFSVLHNLGSRDTLKELKINHITANVDIMKAIAKFTNLDSLALIRVQNFFAEHLHAIDTLVNIRKFTFVSREFGRPHEYATRILPRLVKNDNIVTIIKAWKNVEIFSFGINVRPDRCNASVLMDPILYEKLVDIVLNRPNRRKLMADIQPNFFTYKSSHLSRIEFNKSLVAIGHFNDELQGTGLFFPF